MNVSLKIENDKELRAYIKDIIKGQVLSIAREDILSILKEALSVKTPNVDPDKLLREEIIKIANSKLVNDGSWTTPSTIKQIAREEVQKIVKEMFKTNPVV